MRSATFDVASTSQFAEPTFSNMMRYTAAPESVHLGEAYTQNLRQPSHIPTSTIFEMNNKPSSGSRNNSPSPIARSNVLASSNDISLEDLKVSKVKQYEDDTEDDHVFHLDLTAPSRF
jgi:hypothetical protein